MKVFNTNQAAALRHLIAGGLVLLIAGCSSIATTGNHRLYNEWAYTSATITYLPETVSPQLTEANAGSRISVGASPWGKNTTVVVHNRFFAASGKPCLAASVESDAPRPVAVNLCQYTDQRWGSTRAFQIPVTSDSSARGISQP